jgi:hypothetical protein
VKFTAKLCRWLHGIPFLRSLRVLLRFLCGLCFTAGLSLADTMTTATRTSEMMHTLEARHTDLRLSIGINVICLSIVLIFSPESLLFLRGLILLIILYFQLKSCINREACIAPASASVPASVCASIFEALELLYTFRYTRVGTRLYPWTRRIHPAIFLESFSWSTRTRVVRYSGSG